MSQARKTSLQKPQEPALSFDDAALPPLFEADADVRAWQDARIKAGIQDADAGRFANPEAVSAVIWKHIPNG